MALGQRRYIVPCMGVVPFTDTACIRYVAGGRLPPLHRICYKYRILNVSIIVLHPKNAEKREKYNPCGYTELPQKRTIVHCQRAAARSPGCGAFFVCVFKKFKE